MGDDRDDRSKTGPKGAMVVASVPEVYTSAPMRRARGAGRESVLDQQLVEVLKDVARGAEESDMGLRCMYLVDTLSGEGTDFDEHKLDTIERFVECALDFEGVSDLSRALKPWRRKIIRCRASLRYLREKGDHRSASVLLVAHGYPDPIARQIPELSSFGVELASLARYTDAVEQKRVEMVRAEAASSRLDAEPVNLNMHRERLARADRIIGSSDALRAALSPFQERVPEQDPGENVAEHEARKAAHKARRAAHKARAEAFLVEVRSQARRMLEDAERAYQRAWLECPL